MTEVRPLAPDEITQALALANRVFMRFEAPDYSPEGIENFQRTIGDPAYRSQVIFYGAFDGDTLIGMLATRNAGAHITLFFVEEAYHRKGIGRALFSAALANTQSATITVNSSPFAVEIYQRLGFVKLKDEQVTDGIRYTPMVRTAM